MKKIKIVTDSSADITEQQAHELGFEVVRMPILIDGKEYIENDGISVEEFITKMRQGAVIKTSQSSLGDVARVWDKALKEADEVIYVPISSRLSGSYATAKALADEEYVGKVTVLDLKHVCFPLAYVCQQIIHYVEMGMDTAEIKELFESKAVLWAVLIPEDIIYLKHGGRISAAAAALANLLKIVPLLKVEDGAIDVLEKVRTLKKAYQVGMKACFEVENHDDYCWFIVEADAKDRAIELKAEIEAIYPIKVEIVSMHPVIMAHTGPGTIAFGRSFRVR